MKQAGSLCLCFASGNGATLCLNAFAVVPRLALGRPARGGPGPCVSILERSQKDNRKNKFSIYAAILVFMPLQA